MSELTLMVDAARDSLAVVSCAVALREKGIFFREEVRWGEVPALVHGDLVLTDSMAIVEYIAERFPFPTYARRLFPGDLGERARARQVMAFVRRAPDDAGLLRLADAALPEGQSTMFAEWCLADTDLALALRHLEPALPPRRAFVAAQLARPTVQDHLRHVAPRAG